MQKKYFLILVFSALTILTSQSYARSCKAMNLEIEKALIESKTDLTPSEKSQLLESNRKLHATQVIACALKRSSISEEDGQTAIFLLREEYLAAEQSISEKLRVLKKDEEENSDQIVMLELELQTARAENRQIIRRIEGLIAGEKTRTIAGN